MEGHYLWSYDHHQCYIHYFYLLVSAYYRGCDLSTVRNITHTAVRFAVTQ